MHLYAQTPAEYRSAVQRFQELHARWPGMPITFITADKTTTDLLQSSYGQLPCVRVVYQEQATNHNTGHGKPKNTRTRVLW